LLDILES